MNHEYFSQDSFESFADRWNRIVEFLRHKFPDLDAEELAAMAVDKIITANPSVASGAMYSFLRTTVTRLAYDKLRSKPPTVPLQFEPETYGPDSFWSTSHVERLREEILRLTPKQQVVVEMTMNELSTNEIAQQLGVAPRTVLARYHGAIAILRRRLSK